MLDKRGDAFECRLFCFNSFLETRHVSLSLVGADQKKERQADGVGGANAYAVGLPLFSANFC
jgi:hypothetical protein